MHTEALGYLDSLREAPDFILMRAWGTKATLSDLSLIKAEREQNGSVSLKLLTLNFCEAVCSSGPAMFQPLPC